MKGKICVLTSGGIESAALLSLYMEKKWTVYPLYVRHGFRWEKAELYWLKKLLAVLKRPSLRPLTVLDAPLNLLFKNHWSVSGKHVPSRTSKDISVYLPGRNLLLVSFANAFCAAKKIPRIAIGTLGTNPFPDGTVEFFRTLERIMKQKNGKTVKIERPFGKLSKPEAMKLARRAPFKVTFSCIHPKGFAHCGQCNKCAERDEAISVLRSDPVLK